MDEQTETIPVSPQMSLTEVLRLMPQAVIVFEDADIDYCCKGASSLGDAAAAAGLTCEELTVQIAAQPRGEAADWSTRPLGELTRFLTADHGRSVAHDIPALRAGLESLAIRHPFHQELRRAARLVADFAEAVAAHAAREERDLFPCIAQLESAGAGADEPPKVRIGQFVLREFVEHMGFRDQLRTIRELLSRVRIESGAEILADLLTITADVHHHIYLENNVLYPRAIELENVLRAREEAAVV